MSTSEASEIPNTLPLPGGIPDTHRPHTESTTTILVPKENTAFLNPVQQYNRDLSVAVIRAWNELRKEEQEARWKAKQGGGGKKRGAKKGKGGAHPADPDAKEDPETGEPEAGPSTGAFKPRQITILEALSATGLRSIRYAKEIPDVRVVLANDLSPSACEAMKTNVALNGVGERPKPVKANGKAPKPVDDVDMEDAGDEEEPSGGTGPGEEGAANGEMSEDELAAKVGRREGCRGDVRVNEGDACALMYQHRAPQNRVEVVDLDPYGTAAPFIDAAIGAIADGGLLCVTCTDLAVLAGSQYPEKSFANYGGVSINAEYSHEAALRLVLHSLATTAARYHRQIIPLLSFSIDFYVRLFVRVETKPEKVKQLASQIGTVYVCGYCQTPTIQPLGRVIERPGGQGSVKMSYKSAPGPPVNGSKCEECGGTLHLGGPMWIAPIQDNAFAERVLKGIEGQQKDYGTWSRMHGMLSMAKEELPDPFYFTANKIHGFCQSSSQPTSRVLSALLNGGYKVSRSHASSGSIKTNAPRSFIYDIIRENAKTNPVRLDKIAEGSPARTLITKPTSHEINFEPHPEAKKFEKDKHDKVVYYQANPTSHWGPASRAKTVNPASGKRKGEEEAAVKEEAKKQKVEEAVPVVPEGPSEENALNA